MLVISTPSRLCAFARGLLFIDQIAHKLVHRIKLNRAIGHHQSGQTAVVEHRSPLSKFNDLSSQNLDGQIRLHWRRRVRRDRDATSLSKLFITKPCKER